MLPYKYTFHNQNEAYLLQIDQQNFAVLDDPSRLLEFDLVRKFAVDYGRLALQAAFQVFLRYRYLNILWPSVELHIQWYSQLKIQCEIIMLIKINKYIVIFYQIHY